MKTITANEMRQLLLNNKEVNFTFIKKDGTEREARGTTEKHVLDENCATPNGQGNAVSRDVIKFFDLDKLGWRSAKVESIISVNGEETTVTI